MFTGLIQDQGRVISVKKKKNLHILDIFSRLPARNFKLGSSIAVNGVCLTVESYDKKSKIFQVSAVPETLKSTSVSKIMKGDSVHLEAPLTLSTPLGGHFVLGHVDTVGLVQSSGKILSIKIPKKWLRYCPQKGSISVDGVSLTIQNVRNGSVILALVPETLKSTHLGKLKKGEPVNLEFDFMARYLDHLLNNR